MLPDGCHILASLFYTLSLSATEGLFLEKRRPLSLSRLEAVSHDSFPSADAGHTLLANASGKTGVALRGPTCSCSGHLRQSLPAHCQAKLTSAADSGHCPLIPNTTTAHGQAEPTGQSLQVIESTGIERLATLVTDSGDSGGGLAAFRRIEQTAVSPRRADRRHLTRSSMSRPDYPRQTYRPFPVRLQCSYNIYWISNLPLNWMTPTSITLLAIRSPWRRPAGH